LKSIFKKNKKINDNALNVLDFDLTNVDRDKLRLHISDVSEGVRNFVLFQRNPTYRLPYWLYASVNRNQPDYIPRIPASLKNNTAVDWITFTSLLSAEAVDIDQAGMLSPTYDRWSLEVWITRDGVTARPQECGVIFQERDSAVVITEWKEIDFTVKWTVYAAKTSIDECIVDVECDLKRDIKDVNILMALRPYNNTSIGGIYSIEYKKDGRVISINSRDRIILGAKPDFILCGSESDGDTGENTGRKDLTKVKCEGGMAAMAFGYGLGKGMNEYHLRLSLSRSRKIEPYRLNFKNVRKEFDEYSSLRSRKGFNLEFPDVKIMNWFYALKLSSLNQSRRELGKDARRDYFLVMAYNRMGYHQDAIDTISSLFTGLPIEENPCFTGLIDACYYICAMSDYFTISRNIDYLKTQYDSIRKIALMILRKASGVRMGRRESIFTANSIPGNFVGTQHIYDIILLSYSLKQFAYLSRCMGLFGDEIRFNKETEKLEKFIADYLKTSIHNQKGSADVKSAAKSDDDFSCYDIFAAYPFRADSLKQADMSELAARILEYYRETPVCIRSLGGWDLFASLILAVNLLQMKNHLSYGMAMTLMDAGRGRYALPDIMNPVTRRGVSGSGDSALVNSAMFIFIRNMLFIDHPDRLEIFPVPLIDWFAPGAEIKISDAPSRFGTINMQIVSTRNEIQMYFTDLPKFIPPDILINLPFPTTIKEEDDFVVKKLIGNSFLINGWPSLIKFIRPVS
jgi:hypothetical protein